MSNLERLVSEHRELTRRYFLRLGPAGATVAGLWPLVSSAGPSPELAEVLADLEPYLTPQKDFRDVSRGQPIPHQLPDETKSQVGMTRDTWSLEVISDPENKADLRKPLTKKSGNALNFARLMELAKEHAVRFPKVMTCLNIGCPLGMGIWEGVPLRELIWLTEPRKDLRRVYYYGYHNDKPEQMFRSSLPIDRILEDPFDLPPVILCYKLNGHWLSSERGGPVRVVVPEGYGFKSIKWLTTVVLSNMHHANDTYANGNNDVDSELKSFSATLSVPNKVKAGQPIPVTGYAQSGSAGLAKVQAWAHNEEEPLPSGDKYYTKAPWKDATILPPPEHWGGDLPNDQLPHPIMGFNSESGRPKKWPMRISKAHWAILLPGLPAGTYTLRSRTIDEKGHAQPMPRPFRKSGHAAIEQVEFVVES